MSDKTELARIDSMRYALNRIKEIGTENFEKELEYRCANKLTLPVKQQDLVKEWDKVESIIISHCLLMSLAVLLDEFEFTDEQLKAFQKRYNFKIECLGDDYHLWQAYADMMKEEHNIEVGVVATRKD